MVAAAAAAAAAYSNITLTSRASSAGTTTTSASVNVYLPPGTAPQLSTRWGADPSLSPYYEGSRFEGGSMIGPVLVVDRINAASGGGREPWRIHKNCWRFPGCYNDIPIHDDDDEEFASKFRLVGDAVWGGDGDGAGGDGGEALLGSEGGDVLGKQRNVHAHDHHGGHRPPYYYHRGFPPDYRFLDDIPGGASGAGGGLKSKTEIHDVYAADLWRGSSHGRRNDPSWPESGAGLASEFGYGDDGAYCVPSSADPCGWISDNSEREQREHAGGKICNGVLGYDEADIGEPFLKIGVGKLIKGSCPDCDPSDLGPGGYKFNSPYKFYEKPEWTVTRAKQNLLSMEHEATITYPGKNKKHVGDSMVGYKLQKTIYLDGNLLFVKSTLTNLGSDPFSTPWYSHHFFTCDGLGIGPAGAYGVDLELKPETSTDEDEGDGTPLYVVSGPWSADLEDYAEVRVDRKHRKDSWFDILTPGWWRSKGRESRKTTQITVTREVEEGTRIKAEFPDDGKTGGAFVLHGCGTSVAESIPELDERYRPVKGSGSALSLYAFNLYIERGTLSPEPVMLIELDAGATTSWTQRIEFKMDNEVKLQSMTMTEEGTISIVGLQSVTGGISGRALEHLALVAVMSGFVLFLLNGHRARRRHYVVISDDS